MKVTAQAAEGWFRKGEAFRLILPIFDKNEALKEGMIAYNCVMGAVNAWYRSGGLSALYGAGRSVTALGAIMTLTPRPPAPSGDDHHGSPAFSGGYYGLW
jgi:hypothetical protein